MKTSQLYDFLIRANLRKARLFLTFDDGDTYALANVDLCYSLGQDGQRELEPLRVAFDDCESSSTKRLRALRDGHLKTPGVFWTSSDPIEPVGADYGVENIVTIWDDDRNYFVYERTTAP